MIIGHKQVLKLLTELLAEGNLSTANLFVGPEGVGKMLAAKFVAQKMLCQKGSACGECGKCRRILDQQCEDVCFINPDGDSIKIEQIREAIGFLSLKALGKAKLVIIDHSELMTAQASNALLKTLEEPPKDSYFILLSSQPSRLLPTIRSRCQNFRFHPLSLAEVRAVLDAANDSAAVIEEWMLRACEGQSGKVKRWIENGGESLREKAFHFVRLILDPAWPASFSSISEIADTREEAQDLMSLVLQILRDSYLMCFDMTAQVIHADRENILREFAHAGPSALLKVWRLATRMEQELLLTLDLKLSLENLFLESRNSQNTSHYVLD